MNNEKIEEAADRVAEATTKIVEEAVKETAEVTTGSMTELLIELKNQFNGKIEALEASVKQSQDQVATLIQTLNQVFFRLNTLQMDVGSLKGGNVEVLDFCSGVEKILKDGRALTHENMAIAVDSVKAARSKAGLDAAIKKGEIEAVEIIEEKSFLVSKQTDKEGHLLASRQQAFVGEFPEEYRKKLIGQKAGFKLVLTNKGKGKEKTSNMLEILEIFNPVVKAKETTTPPADTPPAPADEKKEAPEEKTEAPAEAE